MGNLFKRVTIAAALMLSAACTTSQTQVPGLAGPSEFAQSIRLTATPDSISQDGASQSAVLVNAFDANGRPISGLALRIDMAVGGSIQDFGTLSARTIVTGTDGRATTVYTAPPAPPPASGGSGNVVTIVATATGSNFQTANPMLATIRLVPPGIILPPAETPHPRFTFTPTSAQGSVNLNSPTTFDASSSCPGNVDNNGNCLPSPSVITSYTWDFGDGGTATGRVATHTFRTIGTFNVTLTVVNDRGVAASASNPVSTLVTDPPQGDWVFSPLPPIVNGEVIFNADGIRAVPGHSITQITWDFGDGGTASGVVVRHTFTSAGTFTVVMSATDDVGQKTTLPKTITVTTANPTAKVTVTKAGALSVTADGSLSTAVGSSRIVNYLFSWGDGSTTSSAAAVVNHSYSAFGTYTITLTVTDDAVPSRSGTITATPITLP